MGFGKTMSILITGGLGYIGGRLATFLREQTNEKIYLTTTRTEKQLPAWAAKFTVSPMNLQDADSIGHCLQQAQPDTIIHLGAMNQTQCQENFELAVNVNVKGTWRLLDTAVAKGLKRFVYLSTFQVYGKLSGDITEQTLPCPCNLYSLTKRAAEDVVNYYRRSYNLQTLILRLSNAYGYPMDRDVNVWPLAFNAFCRQVMVSGKLTVRSNPYRDFVPMQDAVRAVHHFLYVLPRERWADGLFNLGGNCCLSISEVAQKVAAVYQRKYGKGPVSIEYPAAGQGPKEEAFSFNADKLKHTGFRWTGNMDEEIAKTLALCEESKSGRM